MNIRRIHINEFSTIDNAFRLAQRAMSDGIDKKRFAEILDEAWDDARSDQTDLDRNQTITLL